MRVITLRDIANKANVSVNTVSRALNGKLDISDQTRRRILAIAEEMGYTPNLVAKGLATKRTNTIGVVMSDSANPFYAETTRGIFSAAGEHGHTVLLANTYGSEQEELRAVETLIQRRVDGLIVFSSNVKSIDLCARMKVPVAVAGNRAPAVQAITVTTDDRIGARNAVQYLIKTGRRCILYLGPHTGFLPAVDRWQGYMEAMRSAGLTAADPLPITVASSAGYQFGSTFPALSQYDAIFAFNDMIAIGLLRALSERGVQVPQDVAVIGYDDIEFARYTTPSLTTIRIPKESLGRQAVEFLIARISKSDYDSPSWTSQAVLPTELIVRESA